MMVVQDYFNSKFIKHKFNATTEEIIQKDLLCEDEVKEFINVVDADDEIIAEDVIVTDKIIFNNKIKTEVLASVPDSCNDIIFSNQRKSKDESKDFHSIKKVPSMIYQNTLEHNKTRSTSDSHIVQTTFERDEKVISEKFGNRYNCLDCSNKFSDKIVLAAHSLLYHKTVKRDLCDKWHKKRVNPFKCLECTDSFSHERFLLEHNLYAHNNFRSSKTIRKLKGENGGGLLSYLNHAHPHIVNVKNDKFKCSKCGSLFINECSLSTHYLSTHSMTPKRNSTYEIQTFYDEDKKMNLFTCQNCSSQFPSVYRLVNHSYHMHSSVKEGQFACPDMLRKTLGTKTVKKDSKFYYREKFKCSFEKNNEMLKIPLKSGKKSHQSINGDQLKSQEIFGNIQEVLTSNEVSKEVHESKAKEPLKFKEVTGNKDGYAKILQEVPKYEKITKFEDEVMKDEVIIIVVNKEAEKHPLHKNQNFRKEWDTGSAAVNYTMHSVREEEKEIGNADNLRCSKCNLTFRDLVGLYNHSQSEHEIENQPKRQRKSLLKQISSIHKIMKPFNCSSAKNIPFNNFKTNKATLLANYSLKFTNGRSILRESNIIKLKVQEP